MQIEYQFNKDGKPNIHIFDRDMDGNRTHDIHEGFEPYFYIDVDSKIPSSNLIKRVEAVNTPTIHGDNVKKIVVNRPNDVRILKSNYINTYEADVLYTERFLIDTHYKIEKTPLRVMYLDIETDTHKGDPFPVSSVVPIISMVVYDSFLEKYFTLYGTSEHKILVDFMKLVTILDPDVITAWNIEFDMPYIIDRMKLYGLDPNKLSPLNYTDVRDWEIAISGRTVFDLLAAYRNLHFGELRSFNLKGVAEAELGEEYWNRLDDEELPGDLPLDKLIEYNKKDVQIMVELDKKVGLIDFYYELQILSGSQMKFTLWYSALLDNMLLQDKTYILPTKKTLDYKELKGAIVIDPVKGVHSNVSSFDFSALYPTIMKSFNMSIETIVDEDDECDKYKVGNGVYFKKSPVGLMPNLFIKLESLRNEYKRIRDTYDFGTKEYELWDNKQFATKFLVNALYGVSNFKNFRLNDVRVGASTTYIGREVNKFVRLFIKRLVLMSDTDSFYIQADSVEDCEVNIQSRLNLILDLYSKLKGINHSFPIAFEKFFDKLLLVEKKKRYVYLLSYKDGKFIDPPKFGVTGMDFIRSDNAQISVDSQKELCKMVLYHSDNVNFLWIHVLLKKYFKKIDNVEENLRYYSIPKSFSKSFNKYKIKNLYHKSAEYCNFKYNANIGVGKYNFVYTVPCEVIRVECTSKGCKYINYLESASNDALICEKCKNLIKEGNIRKIEIACVPLIENVPVSDFEIDKPKIFENQVMKKFERVLSAINMTHINVWPTVKPKSKRWKRKLYMNFKEDDLHDR